MNILSDLAKTTIGECLDILDERGETHRDTLGHLSTAYIDSTLREIGIQPERISLVQKQKLFLACMCDQKTTRIGQGSAQKDSAQDLINYTAAWCQIDASPKPELYNAL